MPEPTTRSSEAADDDDEAPSSGRTKNRRIKAFVICAVAIAVLSLGGGFSWWKFARGGDASAADATSGEPTAQTVSVTKGEFGRTISAEGTVEAEGTDDLSFSVSGTVSAVNVEAGQKVSAGQILATISSPELAANAASAEATLVAAQARLADDTDADASDEQIDADEAAVSVAQDQLDEANEALAGTELTATIDGTVTSVDLTVGEQLGSGGTSGTTRSGLASGTGNSSALAGSTSNSSPGGTGTSPAASTTTASSPQIQVVSAGKYSVELAVASADVDAIKVDQIAELTLSTSSSNQGSAGFGGGFGTGGFGGGGFAPPGDRPTGSSDDANSQNSGASDSTTSSTGATATGKVVAVGKIATTSSGVATYPVTVTFEADSTEFFVGSTVTAKINVSARNDVTQASSRAVTTENGRSTVKVAIDGTADGRTETRSVTLGETYNGSVEILSGVKAGETLVVEMPSFGPGGAGAGSFGPPGAEATGDVSGSTSGSRSGSDSSDGSADNGGRS